MLKSLLKKDQKKFKESKIRGRLIMIGSNFAAGVAVLSFLGHWIDKKTGHDILYAAIGGILGVFWGIYEMLKFAYFLNKEEKNQNA